MSRIALGMLPAFVEAARAENLRAAAEVLSLTHSAVSQQISALEERLGYPLFERRGKRLVLNDAGKTLLRHVEPALAQIRQGIQAASTVAAGTTQTLRLTMLPSFAQRWFVPRMGSWQKKYPDITLEIETSLNLIDLQREGFHAGIRTGEGPWPGLVAQRLYDGRTHIVALGSPEAVARMPAVTPAEVARQPLLGSADLWLRWFATAGLQVPVTVAATFHDISLMLMAAEQGLGLALARDLLAADAIRDGKLLKLCDISFVHENAYPHRLVYPPALAEWPPLQALIAWLHDEFAASSHEICPEV